MKKQYLFLLITLASLFFSRDVLAQPLTIQLTDSCPTVKYRANYGPSTVMRVLHIYWGEEPGDSTWIYLMNLPQTYSLASHTYKKPGKYYIKTVLTVGNTVLASTITPYTTYCSYINLNTFLDNNANCTRDSGDFDLASPTLVQVDSAGVTIDTVNFINSMYYFTTPGKSYKLTPVNDVNGAIITCPSSGYAVVTGPQPGQTAQADFGLECAPNAPFDMSLSFTSRFRPVAISRITINAFNNSCQPEDGVLTFNLNNKYEYVDATPTPDSVSGNTLTWNIAGLSIYHQPTIYLNVRPAVHTIINPGDSICNSATITPVVSGDISPANNIITNCEPVRSSWDPNDKSVTPPGDILPGQRLSYRINFENLGDDTAFNIVILDTLSPHLDVKSFEISHSSHKVSYLMFEDTSNHGKILRFEFADIKLADSSAKHANKGFVQYSITAKKGLAPKTTINNTAAIYFDINPPVITNTTVSEIATVSVELPVATGYINAFPNPVTNILNVKTPGGSYNELKLLNTMGQVIKQQEHKDHLSVVDMSILLPGLYYIILSGDDGIATVKVEKQ